MTGRNAAAPRLAAALLAAAALLGPCACAAPRPDSPAGAPVSAIDEKDLTAAVTQAHKRRADYRIGGADLLEIRVLGEKDLDRTVRVGQDGSITYPLVGTIEVGGLTTAAAETEIAKDLADYLRVPQVSVFIKEYGNKRVFVFGQVAKPGAIELPTETPLTVLGAISQAGGFTNLAAPDRTRVIRDVDGVSRSFTIDVTGVTKGGRKDKDLALEPEDIIFVPQSIF